MKINGLRKVGLGVGLALVGWTPLLPLSSVWAAPESEPERVYSGEKLSLNFQSIEVRALLQVLADFTHFNMVAAESVSGSISLRLKDVPWDQALDIILRAKNLGMHKQGNVIWIAPNAEILARERQTFEAQVALESFAPLRMQAFTLNYAKAAQVAAQLGGGASGASAVAALPVGLGDGLPSAPVASASMLSARGSVVAEVRTNQVFVTDVSTRLEKVQAMIAQLDVPVRQVLIEARIVEADQRFGQSLGVRLGGGMAPVRIGSNNGHAVQAALGSSYDYMSAALPRVGAVASGGATVVDAPFVNLPAQSNGGVGQFALSLFNAGASRFLTLELSALEADGRGQIVSSPRVVTANQIKALIEQGTEYPYQAASASGATAVSFRKANLKLEVTPQITPEGNIMLEVDVSKDGRGETTAAGIAINTKHVKTQVLVENGGTVVLGGIFELLERTDVNKVPLLGDIPVLGHLFKNTERVRQKSELLIFLSPRVLNEVNSPS